MTNTQAARMTLQDPMATSTQKRAALQVLQDCFAARYRTHDQVQQARQLIGVAS